MSKTIINKKQYIVVRAVWTYGRPAPAASLSINGIFIGNFICPAASLNDCTTPTSGIALRDFYNSSEAPLANNMPRVGAGGVSNISSCYAPNGLGNCSVNCSGKSQANTFSGLPYLNTRSTKDIVVNFNWTSGGCCFPSCCRRPATTNGSPYNHSMFFVVGYRWGGGGLLTADYTPIFEWGFTNMLTYFNGCSTGLNNLYIAGGQTTQGVLTGCTSGNPDRPANGLVAHGINCPNCA